APLYFGVATGLLFKPRVWGDVKCKNDVISILQL
ncbi:unnamed protein product, partial [Allacma fusca]